MECVCDTNRMKLWARAQSGVCDSTGIDLWARAQWSFFSFNHNFTQVCYQTQKVSITKSTNSIS